jgi:hypothetical protein
MGFIGLAQEKGRLCTTTSDRTIAATMRSMSKHGDGELTWRQYTLTWGRFSLE